MSNKDYPGNESSDLCLGIYVDYIAKWINRIILFINLKKFQKRREMSFISYFLQHNITSVFSYSLHDIKSCSHSTDSGYCMRTGCHFLERVRAGGGAPFRSHFLKFSSTRGGVFKIFRPLLVLFKVFIPSRSHFFHLFSLGLSKWGIIMSAPKCQK